jgi:hypothetical protein
MSQRIPCPHCHRQLLLPADCTAEMLSCPSCHAEIANPQTTASPPEPAAVPPSPQSAVTASPSPLVPGLRLDDGERDTPRDSHGASRSTVFLASLGGLGIAYALLGSFTLLKDGEFRPLLILLSVLVIFTLFSAALAANRHPRDTMTGFLGRTILGVLTITGVGVGVGLLLAVAAAIILFAVCLSNGGKC